MTTLLATIVVLGVLIFVHELGHFAVAKLVGVGVERFSIGLGPVIWGVRSGETEYVLSAIPLGGYVKMQGMGDEMMEKIEGGAAEEGEEGGGQGRSVEDEGGADGPEQASGGTERPGSASDGPRSEEDHEGSRPREDGGFHPKDFDGKPLWARAAVISAGVIMNMVFAFFAYAAAIGFWGVPELDEQRVGQVETRLLSSGTEALAEIPIGARIERVGERRVEHWGDVRDGFLEAAPGPLTVVFSEPDGRVEVQVPELEVERRRVAGALQSWLEPAIGQVIPGSPADRGGLRRGDRILAVDGTPIPTWYAFVHEVRARPGEEAGVRVERDGREVVRNVTPDETEQEDPVTGETVRIGQIGIFPPVERTAYAPVGPGEAVVLGWQETWAVTGMILGFLRDLVVGDVSPRTVGSIVTIGEASGQAAEAGMAAFLRFMALFSINLAILNLLPIPVLDGGHLLFLGIEAFRGKALSAEQRLRWSQVGFIVIVGLMVLALYNDFLRLLGM